MLFTLADAQTSPNFSVIGVMMVSGALVMDAFLGNLQEAIFTMNPETTHEAISKALLPWPPSSGRPHCPVQGSHHSHGDDCEESSDAFAVIHDFHQAFDIATWKWAAADNDEDYVEDVSRLPKTKVETVR
ncbi:hypothetical protein AAHA92_16916 [Salvia divinorum]|uniref:Uncharacterized protein n=1 Tax=Salvia divinorum TaxID=28513 RepID=A0ABD1H032_SALDI